MTSSYKCKRCGVEKTDRPEDYALFEGMHWLCFHLEFEHKGDPDVACADVSCPWWHIEIFKAELIRRGADPQQVLTDAIARRIDRFADKSQPPTGSVGS